MAKFLDDNGLLYFWTKIKTTFYAASNPSGYQANVIETVQKNGTALTVTNKTVNVTVPTNVSDLANDSGYITGINSSDVTTALGYTPYNSSNPSGYQTAGEVTTAINTAIAGITGISFEIVQSLPLSGDAGTIYLLPNSGTSPNIYDEYIWVNNAWEKIGTTNIDLSNYWNTTNLVAITNAEIDTICV